MPTCTPRFLLLTLLALPPAFAQQFDLTGTVLDTSRAAIARVQVRLTLNGRAPDQETLSADTGNFTFYNLSSGPWTLTLAAPGFSTKTLTGDLPPGEDLHLPPTTLSVDTLTTAVNVTQTQAEIAQAQIKVQEQQRLLGVVPNFFVTYDADAVPLTTRQKLELTAKAWVDPSSFLIGGIIAGVWQAQNSHKGFGQGAQGYAKRYGASFADYGTMLLLDKVVAPSLFRQDPRYFYKGAGSKSSRALYAISRAFICRGDNRRGDSRQNQLCYSSLLSRFGTGFATNYYYPAADRDKASVILRNSTIGIGGEMLGNLFQEFVARKLSRRHK